MATQLATPLRTSFGYFAADFLSSIIKLGCFFKDLEGPKPLQCFIRTIKKGCYRVQQGRESGRERERRGRNLRYKERNKKKNSASGNYLNQTLYPWRKLFYLIWLHSVLEKPYLFEENPSTFCQIHSESFKNKISPCCPDCPHMRIIASMKASSIAPWAKMWGLGNCHLWRCQCQLCPSTFLQRSILQKDGALIPLSDGCIRHNCRSPNACSSFSRYF